MSQSLQNCIIKPDKCCKLWIFGAPTGSLVIDFKLAKRLTA